MATISMHLTARFAVFPKRKKVGILDASSLYASFRYLSLVN